MAAAFARRWWASRSPAGDRDPNNLPRPLARLSSPTPSHMGISFRPLCLRGGPPADAAAVAFLNQEMALASPRSSDAGGRGRRGARTGTTRRPPPAAPSSFATPLGGLEEAHRGLGAACLSDADGKTWPDRPGSARAFDPAERPDAVGRSDREAAVEEWLDARGSRTRGSWPGSPRRGPTWPGSTVSRPAFRPALGAVLEWPRRSSRSTACFTRSGRSARISEIVGALATTSYVGQAPAGRGPARGIDNTSSSCATS